MDVVQETFVKVLRGLKSFQERSSLKTWIVRIASNTSLDMRRAHRARPDIGAQELPENALPAGKSPSPAAEAQQHELAAALRDCMNTLSPALAAPLTMFSQGGMRYEETAEALGVARGTVMSRLFYARRKLHECLEDKGFMRGRNDA